VRATDSATPTPATATATVTVTVTDENEMPYWDASSNEACGSLSLAESAVSGSSAGACPASDPDLPSVARGQLQ